MRKGGGEEEDWKEGYWEEGSEVRRWRRKWDTINEDIKEVCVGMGSNV